MDLFIGNRNYSTWSLRIWVLMRHFDMPFTEHMLRLDGPDWKQKMCAATPGGMVPTLADGAIVLDESIAIIEYLAEKFPDRPVWPADWGQRAEARMLAARMHAGFHALRENAPMNLRASLCGRVADFVVREDLETLERLLVPVLGRGAGPFLFGSFCAADAMYAPMAARVRTYGFEVSEPLAEYFSAIFALPAFAEWHADALKESWVVPRDDLDHAEHSA